MILWFISALKKFLNELLSQVINIGKKKFWGDSIVVNIN